MYLKPRKKPYIFMKKEKKNPLEIKLKRPCFIHWLGKKGKERCCDFYHQNSTLTCK